MDDAWRTKEARYKIHKYGMKTRMNERKINQIFQTVISKFISKPLTTKEVILYQTMIDMNLVL